MARYKINKNPDDSEMFVSHGDIESEVFDAIPDDVGIGIVNMPGENPLVVTGDVVPQDSGLDPNTIYSLQAQATIVEEYEEDDDEEVVEGPEDEEDDDEEEEEESK